MTLNAKSTTPNDDKTDAKLKLLEYHRGAMEARRTIGYEGFVSLLLIDLLTVWGMCDVADHINSSWQLWILKVVVVLALGCLFYFFCRFMNDIEKRNALDRDAYVALENEAWRLARVEHKVEVLGESDWAREWPIRASALVAVGCVIAVLMIHGQ